MGLDAGTQRLNFPDCRIRIQSGSRHESEHPSWRPFVAKIILCPMCAERIEAGATFCPHCREEFDQVWRDDQTLVMKKDAELPDRCVKSNLPAETHLPRDLSWHPGWVYLVLVLGGPIFYILVALLIRKTAKISIGLTDAWAAKRRNAILIAWLLALAGLGVIIGGFATLKDPAPVITLLAGILVMIVGAIWGIVGARMVSVSKIDDEYVWLKGVCPEYLDELPEWEG